MGEVKQQQRKPIVRAIDVGYGYTKYTLDDDGEQGEPKVSMFPSIALKQSKQNLGAGFLSERDTVEVIHNGIKYEVGADAILLAKDKDTRNLNDDYVKTNDYAAIMKAVDGNSDDRGMGVILNELAYRIGAGASNLKILDRIDEALRTDMQLKFHGNTINITKYLPYVNEIIEKSVESIITNLGGTGSIQNVILLGGGASLFKPALQARLPKSLKIITPKSGSYANVLGYYSIGGSIVKNEE